MNIWSTALGPPSHDERDGLTMGSTETKIHVGTQNQQSYDIKTQKGLNAKTLLKYNEANHMRSLSVGGLILATNRYQMRTMTRTGRKTSVIESGRMISIVIEVACQRKNNSCTLLKVINRPTTEGERKKIHTQQQLHT